MLVLKGKPHLRIRVNFRFFIIKFNKLSQPFNSRDTLCVLPLSLRFVLTTRPRILAWVRITAVSPPSRISTGACSPTTDLQRR